MAESASIESVTCFVYKNSEHQHFNEPGEDAILPGTDYFLDEYDHVYSTNLESVLVRVTADSGAYGWGEIQAPVVPEVTATLVEELLGPMILGEDPREVEHLWDRMYRTMNLRGHVTSFMVDAMSGLDIACWDLRGKLLDASVATLLGGRKRETLSTYLSGLREDTVEARADLAARSFEKGFDGVKTYFGGGTGETIETIEAIRDRMGDSARIFTDLFWSFTVPETIRLGRRLESLDVEWIEAPLEPEHVDRHAEVAETLDVALAIGEPLRTEAQFRRWFEAGALDIAQPDVGRTGLTGGKRIDSLAAASGIPVAPHIGGSLGLGMAATWHLSSAASTFMIQEHQPIWFSATDEFLDPGLRIEDGRVVVPEGPGLGVDVDEDALREHVAETRTCGR